MITSRRAPGRHYKKEWSKFTFMQRANFCLAFSILCILSLFETLGSYSEIVIYPPLHMKWLQKAKSCFRTEVSDFRHGSGHPVLVSLRGGSGSPDSLASGVHSNDHHPSDALIIGPISNFSKLERFYSSGKANEIFLSKIKELQSKYCGFRSVLGDGNCFIRGYIFRVMESCITNRTEASGFQGLLTGYYFQITDQSKGLGYSPIAIEDFYQDVQNQVLKF